MLTFSASRWALLFDFNFPQNYNAEKEMEFQEVSLSCIIWNGYTNKDEENRLQFYTTLSNLQINTYIYIYKYIYAPYWIANIYMYFLLEDGKFNLTKWDRVNDTDIGRVWQKIFSNTRKKWRVG